MHILHVIIGLEVGGAELMLERLVESHRGRQGYTHSVFSLTEIGIVGQRMRAAGTEVMCLGLRSWRDLPRVLFRLARAIGTGRPDVVQTWMYHADLLGGVAAWLAGNGCVVWGIRTTAIRSGGSRATALARRLCAWLSWRVPRTIVCAAQASLRVHVAEGYDPGRMVVIPNGFDLTRSVPGQRQRDALRAQHGLADGDVVVGMVGRFHPDKDPHNFVQAAGLLARQHAHLRFLMVGQHLDGANSELADWIARTGCADRFVLLGRRVDVPVCLSAMDIFCLPSRTEGFPNVVGEAMAMGLPCVVTDVGDAALLVAETGVVVASEDAAALAQGIGRLLALDAEARRQWGHRARARVEAEFTMDRARERFEAVYARVTGKGGG